MGGTQKAVLITLVLHVVVLGAMVVWPVREGLLPSEIFAEVAMVEAEDDATQRQSFEEQLQEKMAQRVANLRADAQAESSSEARSSASGLDEAQLEAQVEAELRAMEEAEFERLAAEEKEFDTAGEAAMERQEVGETFEAWDAQYDGLVTVRYSLKNRSGRDLAVPGYTCEGAAQVEVAIEVSPTGQVMEASLVKGDAESCFGQAALKSAQRARFNADAQAPRRQAGRLTYVFVAQ